MNLITKKQIIKEAGNKSFIAIINQSDEDVVINGVDIYTNFIIEVEIIGLPMSELKEAKGNDIPIVYSTIGGEDMSSVQVISYPIMIAKNNPLKTCVIKGYADLIKQEDEIVLPPDMALLVRVMNDYSRTKVAVNIRFTGGENGVPEQIEEGVEEEEEIIE